MVEMLPLRVDSDIANLPFTGHSTPMDSCINDTSTAAATSTQITGVSVSTDINGSDSSMTDTASTATPSADLNGADKLEKSARDSVVSPPTPIKESSKSDIPLPLQSPPPVNAAAAVAVTRTMRDVKRDSVMSPTTITTVTGGTMTGASSSAATATAAASSASADSPATRAGAAAAAAAATATADPTLRDSKATFSSLSNDSASIDTRHNVPSIVISASSNHDNDSSCSDAASDPSSSKPNVRKRASTVLPIRVDSKLGSVPAVPQLGCYPRRRSHTPVNATATAFTTATATAGAGAASVSVPDITTTGTTATATAATSPVTAHGSTGFAPARTSQNLSSYYAVRRGSTLTTSDASTEGLPIPAKSPLRYTRSTQSLQTRPSSMGTCRPLSMDEELLSQKLRLMYERGDSDVSDSEVNQMLVRSDVVPEESAEHRDSQGSVAGESSSNRPVSRGASLRSKGTMRSKKSMVRKKQDELAGGIEDWAGIDVQDVDRYGFIKPSGANPPGHSIQRVSTSLALASSSPRRQRGSRNSFISSSSIRSPLPGLPQRSNSRSSSIQFNRPLSSQSGYKFSFGGSKLKYGRRARKYISEAGDMLTVPKEQDSDENSSYAMAMKRREWRREDKWQRMAQITKSEHGKGVTCHFDMQNTKLIERTWKGIPDRWRATAWHSFLYQSSKKRVGHRSDEELIRIFHELQDEGSPDDVQIDLDVPRTISSHIMFRRRYRGGQRLLFRVLHAMSLFFPQTGYVQGMAALAATLLAYYDEENAFVMLVRLWQVRGLERLYRSGFSGLMEALDDFEKNWLTGGEIAEKLNTLNITPTAYGTRWYLTLFNYAIPFPAQLRVWDVFMLLGDSGDYKTPILPPPSASTEVECAPFGKTLDVLHAVSASLIDGMRDIILNSDFENAMKVLTSWVPIKDVELFMRVARIEWKVHSRKKAP